MKHFRQNQSLFVGLIATVFAPVFLAVSAGGCHPFFKAREESSSVLGAAAVPTPLIPSTPPSVESIISGIRADPFGFYLKPTFMDQRASQVGSSLEQPTVFLPFILSPRRQTDQLVSQLYLLLPEKIRSQTAFIVIDRLVQNPEKYLPYLRSRNEIVLIGSFMGTQHVNCLKLTADAPACTFPYEGSEEKVWHDKEFAMLKHALLLTQALNKKLTGLFVAMGDSPTAVGGVVRASIEKQTKALLQTHAPQMASAFSLEFGADELVAMAFASKLPKTQVSVAFTNAGAPGLYEDRQSAQAITRGKLERMNMELVSSPEKAQMHAVIFTLVDDVSQSDAARSLELPKGQVASEDVILKSLRTLSTAEASKTVLIDARLPNGGLDARVVPRRCDFLAFGGWGTMGNSIGSTLAAAKILLQAQNPMARKQLYLEAVAHDTFANGYVETQRGAFLNKLSQNKIVFDHSSGYKKNWPSVKTVFDLLNHHVNERMGLHFEGTDCFKGRRAHLSPQFWRTFESEAHVLPAYDESMAISGVKHRNPDDKKAFSAVHESMRQLDLK